MGLKRTIKNVFIPEWRRRKYRSLLLAIEKRRLKGYPRFKDGYSSIFGKPFKFHDTGSFFDTYRELFIHEIYKFVPSGKGSVILDCGANMGLSVLYFAKNYPNHTIIAFEPEEHIFDVLKENIQTHKLQNVRLMKNAVWDKEEQLSFYTDRGMGGRVNVGYENQAPTIIHAIPLKDFLTGDVEFLKMDIEGAEDVVLQSCASELKNIQYFFFEFHNNVSKPQCLHTLLKIIDQAGFHYYIKESSTRKRPFIDTGLICETFDMALNIFCYRDMGLKSSE